MWSTSFNPGILCLEARKVVGLCQIRSSHSGSNRHHDTEVAVEAEWPYAKKNIDRARAFIA
jgi:hypothetical protein